MSAAQSTSRRLHEALTEYLSRFESGDRLPSEPELARQMGVSRATLREAMRSFETQGRLYRRQGSGTYVARQPQVIDSGLEMLESIEKMASRVGLPVSMGELRIEKRQPNEDEVENLSLGPGKDVFSISRVILTEGQPAAFLIDILPEDVLDLSELADGFHGSVLDLLLQRQVPGLSSSRCEITATTASSEVARALGIQRGDVLLCFTATLYTTAERVIDYSFSYFLPGYFRFHVVRRVG
jgi:GntR family transcriptional regulator